MRVMIVGIIVLTLGVAGVATYLIQEFSPEEVEEVVKVKPDVFRVLIVNKPMQAGTRITVGDVEWQVWAEENQNVNYITISKDDQVEIEIKKVTGSILRRAMVAGEPLIKSKLYKGDQPGYVSGMLKPGKRAVTLAVNQITGTAGFISPGDWVDLILTHDKLREIMSKFAPITKGKPLIVISTASETIMRKIRVLAIGQKVAEVKDQAAIVPTVTLELTPKQAELVTIASRMGILSVILRSLEEDPSASEALTFSTDVEVSPFLSNIKEVLKSRLAKPKPKPKPKQVVAAAPAERVISSSRNQRPVPEPEPRPEIKPDPKPIKLAKPTARPKPAPKKVVAKKDVPKEAVPKKVRRPVRKRVKRPKKKPPTKITIFRAASKKKEVVEDQ